MRAIVTGASGFLGQHLVHELRHQGVTVVSICRRAGSVLSAVSIGEAPWNPTRLARIFEEVEPDLIFHLAGGMHGEPMDLRRVNVGLASSITRAVLDAGIRPALVFCGSAAEYGASIVDGVPISEKMICVPVSTLWNDEAGADKAGVGVFRPDGHPGHRCTTIQSDRARYAHSSRARGIRLPACDRWASSGFGNR